MTPPADPRPTPGPTPRPDLDFVLMGVLNATDDSFSDGGRFHGPGDAIAAGMQMVGDGAAILDVGGESTRPGASRISAAEQIRRVVPVIRGLRDALGDSLVRDGSGTGARGGVALSVDTTRAAVAKAAAEAGATLLNDVSAGLDDAEMFSLAAERSLSMVLMHKAGEPADMQRNPTYGDVCSEVVDHLRDRAAVAAAAGVPRVLLDPGIGFGKRLEDNLALLGSLPQLVGLGHDVLLGTSRKSFLARLDRGAATPADRLPGTLATAVLGLAAGVRVFRVHDVPAHRQALAVARAVLGAATASPNKS